MFHLYLLNIFLVALPLALFEINLEKANGWGGGWPKDAWYARSVLRDTKFAKALTKVTKLEVPLNYHIVLCLIVFPSIFILEYIYGSKNILFLASCLMAILFFADFFWFLLNWHFDSFRQLLKGPKGSIWWHKGWIRIGKDRYIPTVYPVWLGISVALFLLAARFPY